MDDTGDAFCGKSWNVEMNRGASLQRREFNLCCASLAALPLLGMGSALAQPHVPQEGIDYLTLDKAVASQAPTGMIEVVEFFWYSCPHCNAFEPRLEAWIKRQPQDVTLRRVPVAFRDSFVPQQRLFYALEAMGRLDQLHPRVYIAIHRERRAIDNQARIAEWVAEQGVDPSTFSELYASPAVEAKARRAARLQEEFKVQGVPALGIAGRYYTDISIAITMDRTLQVADYLIAQARRNKP
jgi:thiol:disulfide interchange protein DsbA